MIEASVGAGPISLTPGGDYQPHGHGRPSVSSMQHPLLQHAKMASARHSLLMSTAPPHEQYSSTGGGAQSHWLSNGSCMPMASPAIDMAAVNQGLAEGGVDGKSEMMSGAMLRSNTDDAATATATAPEHKPSTQLPVSMRPPQGKDHDALDCANTVSLLSGGEQGTHHAAALHEGMPLFASSSSTSSRPAVINSAGSVKVGGTVLPALVGRQGQSPASNTTYKDSPSRTTASSGQSVPRTTASNNGHESVEVTARLHLPSCTTAPSTPPTIKHHNMAMVAGGRGGATLHAAAIVTPEKGMKAEVVPQRVSHLPPTYSNVLNSSHHQLPPHLSGSPNQETRSSKPAVGRAGRFERVQQHIKRKQQQFELQLNAKQG